MGTKTKLISKPDNFVNSQYARNFEEQRAAIQDYFKKNQDNYNAMSENAAKEAEKKYKTAQRATNRERQKQGNSVSDITGLQDRLWRAGYYGDIPYEKAVDGIMGRMTRQAMAAAQEDAKKNQKRPVTTSTTINPIDSIRAQELYQNNSGLLDVGAAFLYHDLMPENMPMPHSRGLKEQLAAAVAFDQSKQGFHRTRPDGTPMISYDTWGKLSGSSANINKQGTNNNAASNVMGGLTYYIDGDKVVFPDTYQFMVVRDNKTPNPKAVYYSENDPYYNKPFSGLWSDALSGNLSFRDMMENYGTRRGKSRDNKVVLTIDEINEMNSRHPKAEKQLKQDINDNFWSNFSDFK